MSVSVISKFVSFFDSLDTSDQFQLIEVLKAVSENRDRGYVVEQMSDESYVAQLRLCTANNLYCFEYHRRQYYKRIHNHVGR